MIAQLVTLFVKAFNVCKFSYEGIESVKTQVSLYTFYQLRQTKKTVSVINTIMACYKRATCTEIKCILPSVLVILCIDSAHIYNCYDSQYIYVHVLSFLYQQ